MTNDKQIRTGQRIIESTISQCAFCFGLFFFKQKTAYEISLGLVGSEMCIRDRTTGVSNPMAVDRKL